MPNLSKGYEYSFTYDGDDYYGEFVGTFRRYGYTHYKFRIDGEICEFNSLHIEWN